MRPIPAEKREAIIAALKAGERQVDIAERVGVSQSMVSLVAKQSDLTRRVARRQDEERHCHCCGERFIWKRNNQSVWTHQRKVGKRSSQLVTCGSPRCAAKAATITKRKRSAA